MKLLPIFIIIIFTQISRGEKERLHILGLYPFTGSWPAGKAIHTASQMAIDQINANQTILEDYELVLISRDSAVSKLFS